jgi:hypothetical protein
MNLEKRITSQPNQFHDNCAVNELLAPPCPYDLTEWPDEITMNFQLPAVMEGSVDN